MWSLRMCGMVCACAWLAAAAVIELPCEQPPCILDSAVSTDNPFLVKGGVYSDNTPELRSRYGNLVGVLFLFTKGPTEQVKKLEEAPKRSQVHPVIVTEDGVLEWVPATKSTAVSLSDRAFVAGKEGWDGSPLWVIRANYSGELIPGKLAIKHRAAYIPYGGEEVPVNNFEVLCAPQHSLRWIPARNKFRKVPDGAIIAGSTDDAAPLYIARCRHMRSSTPGKFDPTTGIAHISFSGAEISCWRYELLSRINTFTESSSSSYTAQDYKPYAELFQHTTYNY